MRPVRTLSSYWGEKVQELNGYIKLFRKLIRWGWYQDSVVKSLFLHCLLIASFRDFNWMDQRLNAGQFVTSYKRLAEDLGFSVQQIRTALKKLESTGEITSTSTNKFTVITIVNWENYQSDEDTPNTQGNKPITNEQQTNNKQITNEQQHRKNIKKNKKIKKRENTRTRETPSEEVIIEFCNDINVPEFIGRKFFDYYQRLGWMTNRGTDVSDCWQDKLIQWNTNEVRKQDKQCKTEATQRIATYDRAVVDRLINSDG